MALKSRQDFKLKETERLWDAIKDTNTHVKDYGMAHIVQTIWEPHTQFKRTRRVELHIGGEKWVGYSKSILDAVNRLLEDTDEDAHLWVAKLWIDSHEGGKEMIINTSGVNKECLRDHVAEVTVGNNKAIIDLEELLKATRYA